jgi:hypothetical protein
VATENVHAESYQQRCTASRVLAAPQASQVHLEQCASTAPWPVQRAGRAQRPGRWPGSRVAGALALHRGAAPRRCSEVLLRGAVVATTCVTNCQRAVWRHVPAPGKRAALGAGGPVAHGSHRAWGCGGRPSPVVARRRLAPNSISAPASATGWAQRSAGPAIGGAGARGAGCPRQPPRRPRAAHSAPAPSSRPRSPLSAAASVGARRVRHRRRAGRSARRRGAAGAARRPSRECPVPVRCVLRAPRRLRLPVVAHAEAPAASRRRRA